MISCFDDGRAWLVDYLMDTLKVSSGSSARLFLISF